jgi:type I restriction enzyme, R subunit
MCVLLSEEMIVEKPLVEFLESLGWSYVESDLIVRDYDDAFDRERLSDALFKLNHGVLISPSDVDRVIDFLRRLPNDVRGNKQFFQWLKNEESIGLRAGEHNQSINLIDYENLENNTYTVTTQYKFQGYANIRPDIVLLINGIPLVLIECKTQTSQSIDYTDGINQILRYDSQAPQLFKYLAYCCSTDGFNFRYGWTNEKRYFQWRNGYEDPLESAARNLLTREKVLDFIQNFIIFETTNEEITKKIAMQQQIQATNELVKRVQLGEHKKGLVWHTQGSGKTLTMLFTAWKLKRQTNLDNPTVLLVIDRLQLKQQFSDTFTNIDSRYVTVVASQKDLIEKIRTQSKGILITTIQKFRKTSYVDPRKNIVIMIDEAHRTQYGNYGIWLRDTFPNATLFGFTGTPIDKGPSGKSTFRTFCLPDEKYLHKYSIRQSIEDGATVPIIYEPRCSDEHVPREILDKEFLKITEGLSEEDQATVLRGSAKLSVILKAEHRMEKIAKDIAEHFTSHVEPNGFKAQIVAVDREACAVYKDYLDKYLPEDYTKVIYSSSPKDDEPNNKIGPLLKKNHMARADQIKLTQGEFQKKETLPKILIVTDMLLTGFDAPIERVMYLDKPLRDHTLLQAIARTNRPYPGKDSALIIDYVGIFYRLKDALNFESQDIEGVAEIIDALKDEFREVMEQLDTLFEGVPKENTRTSLIAALKLLSDEEKYKQFKEKLSKARSLFETIAPDPFLSPYIFAYTWYNKINEAKNKQERAGKPDLKPYMEKTRRLIRDSVILNELANKLPILEIGPEYLKKLEEQNLPDELKVVELRQAIKYYIRIHVLLNPTLESLSERLERIIQGKDPENIKKGLEEILEDINQFESEREEKQLSREQYSVYNTFKGHLPEEDDQEIIDFTKSVLTNVAESGLTFSGWNTKTETRKDVRRFIFDQCYQNYKDKGSIMLDLTDDLMEMIPHFSLE